MSEIVSAVESVREGSSVRLRVPRPSSLLFYQPPRLQERKKEGKKATRSMSYAKRYERLQQAYSGSRERMEEEHLRHGNSTAKETDTVVEQPSQTLKTTLAATGTSGEKVFFGGDGQLPEEDHRRGDDAFSRGLTASALQTPTPPRPRAYAGAADAVRVTTNAAGDPQEPRSAIPKQTNNGVNGEEGNTQAVQRQRSATGVASPNTPSRTARKAHFFGVSAKESLPSMPLAAGSRKHFETPLQPADRRRRGGAEPDSSSPAGAGRTAKEALARKGTENRHHHHHRSNNNTSNESFTPRSAVSSSASASAKRSVETEILNARLQAVAQAREEVERLVRSQSQYEERIVGILASLEEECRQQQEEFLERSASLQDPLDALRRAERERDMVVGLLRQFKAEGSAVVQRMYDAVKARDEENVRLLAAQDALRKENKQLRQLFTADATRKKAGAATAAAATDGSCGTNEGGRLADGLADSPCSPSVEGEKSKDPVVSERELALEAQVREQKAAVRELGELLSSADETMRALQKRVIAAERQKQILLLRAAGLAFSSLDFAKRSPSPTGGRQNAEEGEEAEQPPAAMQRLLEKYPGDADVTRVRDLWRADRARIRDLQSALRHEREVRMRAEVVAQEIAAESDKSIRTMEERLQRAETPRGLTVPTLVFPRPESEEKKAAASGWDVLAGESAAAEAAPKGSRSSAAALGTPRRCSEEEDGSSLPSTPTRQLRTALSEADDLASIHPLPKENEGAEKPPTQQGEGAVVEEDTSLSPSLAALCHVVATQAEDESVLSTPQGKGNGKNEAREPASEKDEQPTSAAAQAVKAYVGQRAPEEARPNADVPTRATLPIPVPLHSGACTGQHRSNSSSAHRNANSTTNATESPQNSHASGASSVSRRMVLSLTANESSS